MVPARIVRVLENKPGSTSNAGPPNSQAGHYPSTSFNTALAGHPSNYAESDSGSHDSWDDCDQYLEDFCIRPYDSEDRERLKEKSRHVIQAEKQEKQEREKAKTWSRWSKERRENAEGSPRNRG
ncbi:hypothetical protein PAXINDRAFT_16321 [Paxillus involutus ATCC 200175]|uniref:Uncharacterized protein n=1 Tax=Paxillus involutus ATCC 200175 TaxID=664439 RepID=A0A0C9TJ27_PAXIN|nr:hypothetical protein PAXINDRAFT_16321 [Paxillus involutus ATCC 200175]